MDFTWNNPMHVSHVHLMIMSCIRTAETLGPLEGSTDIAGDKFDHGSNWLCP